MTNDDLNLWEQFTRGLPIFVSRPAMIIVRPSKILDLHGLPVNIAYTKTMIFLRNGQLRGEKSLTIITGRSGIIRQECQHWFTSFPHVRKIEELNGGGAFKVYFILNT